MEYKELAKLYHLDASASHESNLQSEERSRREAASTFRINLETPNGKLFIAVPRELSVLSEKVLRAEHRVSAAMRSLPGISASAVMRSLVLDEVVYTNAIEDIHSTRRQVKEALEATKGAPDARRFKELAILYLSIPEGDALVPAKPEDIRTIYDKVMDGELADGQIPDGRIFRKDGVDITAGGVAVIHRGIEPEAKIIEAVQTMLYLVESGDMPALYAAIASHYIFEYAHPFYDGNGRTGRYLLSLFLSESLSAPTVLCLSRMILENRDTYYRAFRIAENPLNRGELTFFVHSMLELLLGAQVGILDRLERSKTILDGLDESMNAAKRTYRLKPQECQIVFTLMQYESFGLMGDASVEELSRLLSLGYQMTRLYLKALEEKGIVGKLRKRNPLTFALTAKFMKEYEVEAPEWRIPVV
ncbi:MAG: Fic family protein [Gordonibacter sp.]